MRKDIEPGKRPPRMVTETERLLDPARSLRHRTAACIPPRRRGSFNSFSASLLSAKTESPQAKHSEISQTAAGCIARWERKS